MAKEKMEEYKKMAERRMFSKRIINSARFLKMPVSTQCLYFHLGLNADDDGIVEAYMTMNIIGATEDDLKILVAKNLVQVLNEDLVTYITDWRENNTIRADRKVDSIYKDLLLQIKPDAPVLQGKERADRKKNDNIIPQEIPQNKIGTSHGQPMDGIGKDRIGEDSINIYIKIQEAFNEKCPYLSSIKKITDKRKKAINARLEEYGLDMILEVFKTVNESDFLCNRNSKNDNSWKASFDWIMNPNNFVKIIEGNYSNKPLKAEDKKEEGAFAGMNFL